MTITSGVLPITTGLQNVATCGVGQEIAAFGLMFVNSSAVLKTVTLSIHRAATGTTVTMPVEIAAKERYSWPKPIALQPGDTLDVLADAVGVNLLWSVDVDTGATPILTGFTPRGLYSGATPYSANDVVFYSSTSYVGIRASTGSQPDTHPADWMVLVDGSGLTAIQALIVNGAPSNMDTLGEIAASLGNDPAFATTIAAALATKANTSALPTGATAAQIRAATDNTHFLEVADLYASGNEVNLTNSGSTIITTGDAAPDMSKFDNAYSLLGGNWSLPNPSVVIVNKGGRIRFQQDSTGGRTLAFGTFWKPPAGVTPSMPIAANAIAFLDYEVISATYIRYSLTAMA